MITITVVLIEPEVPGNTGAIFRSMKNFGFEKSLIIAPKFSMKSKELKDRAKWAQDLITKAKVLKTYNKNTVKNLHKTFDYVITTTARVGTDYNIPRSPLLPEQLAERITELKDARIALVMGREGQGLSNEEIAQADFTVTIPASKEYPTMNLSHATTIILYELSKKLSAEHVASHITPVSATERDQIMKMLEGILKNMYFPTESKRETQRIVWKKMVAKSFLTKREAYALMGFLKKIKKET